jgi:hypothetical protein
MNDISDLKYYFKPDLLNLNVFYFYYVLYNSKLECILFNKRDVRSTIVDTGNYNTDYIKH